MPYRNGFEFDGWYEESDTKFKTKIKSKTIIEEDVVFVAKWKPYYTISFDTDGGQEIANPSREVLEGNEIGSLPSTLKDGYFFQGWFDENNQQITKRTIVNSDMTLKAVWKACEHPNVETIENVVPTCTSGGHKILHCLDCNQEIVMNFEKLGHNYETKVTSPTCSKSGFTTYTCKTCGSSYTGDTTPATGIHTYGRYLVKEAATKYAPGEEEAECSMCGRTDTRAIPPTVNPNTLSIKNFVYTGGKYTNTPFVNMASNAVASSTSNYRVTLPSNVVDGKLSTYWSPDTLVDGRKPTGDILTIDLASEYEVGAVEMVITNYYSWELGDGCTVVYDIEAYVDGQWQKLGQISDSIEKDMVSQNVTARLVLPQPVTTNRIRAIVVKASRYTPAMVYEFRAYAYREEIQREPQSIASVGEVSISGKYNAYGGSAASITDGNLSSSWFTDARDWVAFGNGVTKFVVPFTDDSGNMKLTMVNKVVINASKYVGEKFTLKYATTDDGIDQGKNWNKVGSYEIKSSDGSDVVITFEVNAEVAFLRLEVEGYGNEDLGFMPTATKLEIESADGTKTFSPISWTLRHRTWATFTFPEEQYLAYIKWFTDNSSGSGSGRIFSLQLWEVDENHPNGYWKEFGQYTLQSSDPTVCFTVDVNKNVKGIRLEIIKEPCYWQSFVFEITPYTYAEVPVSLDANSACKHVAYDRNLTEVVNPTCESAGYTKYYCKSCDYTWTSDALDATGHKWGKSGTASTDANGNKTLVYTCPTCNKTKEIVSEYKLSNGSFIEAPSITQYYHNAQGAWSMTFDDGNYISTYEWVIPQLQKYGFKATAVLAVSMSDMYVDNWRDYFATGTFDLGSHSKNHEGLYHAEADENLLLADVNEAHFKLMSLYHGQRLLGFAAPNGTTSTDVANILTDLYAANRNGGQSGAWIDTSKLNTRAQWGSANTYVSKSNQTEGTYVYVKKGEVSTNYVFNEATKRLANQPSLVGTYRYIASEWKYEWLSTGSYDYDGSEYVFRNDNNGEYVLVHTKLGSYEEGINTLLDNHYWTVECIHSLGWGEIYSSYNSTISKFEYLKKTGTWVCSYTEGIQYIKESQCATIENVTYTDSAVSFDVTDTLDDFMFNFPLTIKVKLQSGWTSVSATQDGNETNVFIENGYAYVDAIPDGGVVVITKN